MNANKEPFRWEGSDQANDRLQGTYIRFGDSIAYVRECSGDRNNLVVYYTIVGVGGGKNVSSSADDPRWHDFRLMPPLGWVNVETLGYPHAVLINRRTVRTRRHGINGDSVSLYSIQPGVGLAQERSINLGNVYESQGAAQAVLGEFPTVSEIIERLPNGCSAAASPLLCVAKDSSGLSKVYRKDEELGYITKGGLYILPKFMYRVDELREEPNFDISEIKEF